MNIKNNLFFVIGYNHLFNEGMLEGLTEDEALSMVADYVQTKMDVEQDFVKDWVINK